MIARVALVLAFFANAAVIAPALSTGAEGPTSFAGAQAGPTIYAANTSSGNAVQALSATGPALYGHSASGVGLLGSSRDYVGVEGVSGKSVGVKGLSYSWFGVVGESHAGGYLAGVYGVNVSPTPGPTGIPGVGVTGYSANGLGVIAQTSYGQEALLAFAGAKVLNGTMQPPQGHAVAVYGENSDAQYPPAQFVQENGSGPLLLVVNSATGAWAEVDAQGNLHISGQVYAGSAPLPTPMARALLRRR